MSRDRFILLLVDSDNMEHDPPSFESPRNQKYDLFFHKNPYGARALVHLLEGGMTEGQLNESLGIKNVGDILIPVQAGGCVANGCGKYELTPSGISAAEYLKNHLWEIQGRILQITRK